MGDRGNIFFVDTRQGETFAGIYMYTHWSGPALPGLVREALARGRGRWGDPPYLARVVFCELVKDSVLEEVGYGLSTRLGDNEHNIVRIDDLGSRVSFHAPGREWRTHDPGVGSWSYEEYLAAPALELERAFFTQLDDGLPGEPKKQPKKPKKPKAAAATKPKTAEKPKAAAATKPKAAEKPKAAAATKPKAAEKPKAVAATKPKTAAKPKASLKASPKAKPKAPARARL